MNWIKANWQFVVIVALAIVIVLITCKAPKPLETIKSDTVTKVIVERPVFLSTYTPTPTSTTPVTVIPPAYQPAPDYSGLITQYNALLQKYLETNNYDETFPLTDSAGNDRGYFSLKDKVSENKLGPRTPSYQLKYPVVTITNTQVLPYRQFYIGGGLKSTLQPSIIGAEGSIAYKDKQDNQFQADLGALRINKITTPYIGLKYLHPLGKKKK